MICAIIFLIVSIWVIVYGELIFESEFSRIQRISGSRDSIIWGTVKPERGSRCR